MNCFPVILQALVQCFSYQDFVVLTVPKFRSCWFENGDKIALLSLVSIEVTLFLPLTSTYNQGKLSASITSQVIFFIQMNARF